MSKTCQNCGNIFEDSTNTCPRCGMQYIEAQPIDNSPYQNQSYQQPQQQYGYNQQQQQQYNNGYGQPYQQNYRPPVQTDSQMTLGSWVGTVLLTNLFGIVSIILLFVWGFSDSTPPAKKNYCRAMLIYRAIMIGVTVLLTILFFSLMLSSPDIFDSYYF